MSFPSSRKHNLGKLEIFRFLVEIQEKKAANFLEKIRKFSYLTKL